jgi:hypothetical protein
MAVGTPELMSIQSTDREGGVDYRLRYRVICTASPATDTHALVKAALAAVTVYKGATFTTDTNAVCTELGIEVDAQAVHHNANAVGVNTWHWTANAVFTTRATTDAPSLSQTDPTLRRPRFRVDTVEYQAVATKDQNGDPVENSAGDPVRRERPKSRKLFVIDRDFASYDPSKLDLALPGGSGGFLYSRNLNTWNPFGAYATLYNNYTVGGGKGLVKKLAIGEPFFENKVPYLPVHLEVLEDPDNNRDRFWDEGFRGYVVDAAGDAGFVLVHLQDPRTGAFVSSPVPLDGDGQALVVGQPLFELNYAYFPQKDWSAVGTGLGF